MLKSLMTALVATTLLAAAPGDAAAQAQQDFVLINRTGYQIDEVYVALPTQKTWGRDILGEGVLANGARKEIKFVPSTSACQWEIKVKFEDGEEVEWNQPFDLCTINSVTLRYNKSTGVTTAVTD